MATKCFYHSADLDGQCSGAIVNHFEKEVQLFGFNYGEPFPWDAINPSDTVYMVDVSLPIPDMVRLAKFLKQGSGCLIYIDHHISVIEGLKQLSPEDRNLIKGIQNTKFSACELCWKHFSMQDSKVPIAVELLGIYDTWRHDSSNEDRVLGWQYGMRRFKNVWPVHSMPFWEQIFNLTESDKQFKSIMHSGKIIHHYQQTIDAKQARGCSFETTLVPGTVMGDSSLKPLKCIAANTGYFNSQFFKSVYDPTKHDAMLMFQITKRGDWKVSIYTTKEEVDCSKYAGSYGGGGHGGAAGFIVPLDALPFKPNQDFSQTLK